MAQTRNFSWPQPALVVFLLCANAVKAGDWDITPRLTVGGGYSDNIFLEPKGTGDWIGEVTPGISLRGESARTSAFLDYQLQNVFFQDNSDGNSSYNQLNSGATVELSKDLFFVDATAQAGQAAISATQPISVGNLNINTNQTDFVTYSISPYLQSHLGSYADARLRYRFSETFYDTNEVSDATINAFDANFISGRNFKELAWFANYNYRNETRDTASDLTYESLDSEARYGLSKEFSLVGQAGYENNDNVGQNNVTGPYWAAGGSWQPSRFYSLQALTGKNLTTATVALYPTVRTSFLAIYRDLQVGTNPGPKWTWDFSHYTRRTTWNARYFEETTTVQQLTSQSEVNFLGVDPITGEVNPNPQPGDLLVESPTEVTSLTNEVFERKRASGSVGMNTGKNGLLVTLWNERRESQETQAVQKTRGITGTWNRRLAPRTNSVLTASWYQATNEQGTGDQNVNDNNLWYVQATLLRQISRKTQGTIQLRHTEQNYPDNDRLGYNQNLIFARLITTF